MVSLSNKHCLLVSFLFFCFSFVNVASAAGNETENPNDLTQSLHTLNDALVTFDQTVLVAYNSVKSLTQVLDIFDNSVQQDVDMPREALVPVYNAASASHNAVDNFFFATSSLLDWSGYGIKMYTALEDDNSPDDVFYKVIQSVITEGHTYFNQSIEKIHTVITQLQLLENNLTQINVQPKDIKKDTDFVKMVSFVIQLAQEDSQVGRDLMAELQKIGPIPTSETEKLDPVQKSKIIQAYLNVFKKTVADSIESLSKLKVGQQSQLAEAPQAGQVSIGGEGNNGQEGDAARKMVFEAFKQLDEAMILYIKHLKEH